MEMTVTKEGVYSGSPLDAGSMPLQAGCTGKPRGLPGSRGSEGRHGQEPSLWNGKDLAKHGKQLAIGCIESLP